MRKKIVFIIPIILLVIGIVLFDYNKPSNKIERVLNNKYYSYLPKEAKEYIKEVYKETGEVILTEKNKEENTPYLNPKYIAYLELSDSEKKKVELIPDIYSVDYDYTKIDNVGNTESTYSLKDDNYLTPTKDQDRLGICWAFAATEQAESFVMAQNTQPYNDNTKRFSARQMDYATSTNGIKDYTNEYGNRPIGDGGNFFIASSIMSYGLSLTDEAKMPFSNDVSPKEMSDVLNFANSNYEVNQAINLPNIASRFALDQYDKVEECMDAADFDECLEEYTNQLKEDYIDEIKVGIKEYGGAFAGTVSPQGTCAFVNTDGEYVINQSGACYDPEEGHAMQVIGWDDDYTYTYCKGSKVNTSLVDGDCESGTKTTGKGAFILRNSWGKKVYENPYLTYDSIEDSTVSATFSFITDMSPTSERSWDNVYENKLDYSSGYIYNQSTSSQSFTKKIGSAIREKLEQVKFSTLTGNGTYSVTFSDGYNTYKNIASITTDFPGLYTIDLSDKNIIIDVDTFTITINSDNSKNSIIKDSISVFTSNVNNNPLLRSERKNISDITLDAPGEYSNRIIYYTKNINSNELLNISLQNKDNVDVSSYLTVTNNEVANNKVNASIEIHNLPKGKYKLVASYGDAKDEIPITVQSNDPMCTVRFINTRNNKIYTKEVECGTAINLQVKELNNSDFYTGQTIWTWSTDPSLSLAYQRLYYETIAINEDTDFYTADWAYRYVYINYQCDPDDDLCVGNKNMVTYYQDELVTTPESNLTKDGYKFIRWETTNDISKKKILYPGEKISTKDIIDNQVFIYNIDYYPHWSNDYYTVKLHSNYGNDTVKEIYFEEIDPVNLGLNLFERDGYKLVSWTTNQNGTGDSYTPTEVLDLNANINLYAQWSPISYKVRFNANGGEGSMEDQTMTYDVNSNLYKNTFTKENYKFIGWSLDEYGTEILYKDQQLVKNLTKEEDTIINLYAQYEFEERIGLEVDTNMLDYGFSEIGTDKKLEKTITIKNTSNIPLGFYFNYHDYDYSPNIFSNENIGGVIIQPNQEKQFKIVGQIDKSLEIGKYLETIKITGVRVEGEEEVLTSYDLKAKIELKPPQKIAYRTHVQKEGWQDYSYDGKTSGTSGKSLRLEGIEIKLQDQNYSGNVEYRTHVQSYGWEKEFKKNGETSGTIGEAKRLEAIEIKLTGNMAEHYDIYYRVHAQKFGWLGWARNGESAGTAGYAYRLEAIEIKLVEKDSSLPNYGERSAYEDKNYPIEITLNKSSITLEEGDESDLVATIKPTNASNKNVTWTSSNEEIVVVDNNGHITAVHEGNAVVTAKTINGKVDTCSITVLKAVTGVAYKTHVQSYGWQDYVYNGEMSGTSGEAKRLEGIKIKLKNQLYTGDIEYRTHVQSYGWQDFKKNDEMSGTSGEAKRLEAIEIRLTGKMAEHYDVYYRVHAQSFGWLNWAKNGESSGTAGYAKRLEGIEIVLVEKGENPPARSNQNDERSFVKK